MNSMSRIEGKGNNTLSPPGKRDGIVKTSGSRQGGFAEQPRDRVEEIAVEYFEASNRHDLQAIENLLDANVVYRSSSVGEFVGAKAVIEMTGGFFGKYVNVKWDFEVHAHRPASNTILFSFTINLGNGSAPAAGTELVTVNALGKITKVEVFRGIETSDWIAVTRVLKDFEDGLKERNARKACAHFADDVLYVNQWGTAFIGRESATKGHEEILKPTGELKSKPPAEYDLIRLLGSSKEGCTRALVHWRHPLAEQNIQLFSAVDPSSSGYLIFNFQCENRTWKISSIQNSPTLTPQRESKL